MPYKSLVARVINCWLSPHPDNDGVFPVEFAENVFSLADYLLQRAGCQVCVVFAVSGFRQMAPDVIGLHRTATLSSVLYSTL